MNGLFESLQVHFAQPLSDGRTIRLAFKESDGGPQIIAYLTGFGPTKFLETIHKSEDGFLVEDADESVLVRRNFQEVVEELERRASYSNGCWYCKQSVVLTASTRCPKCKTYVRCTCGKCLCDKVPVRPALTPDEITAMAKELTERYGHLFT